MMSSDSTGSNGDGEMPAAKMVSVGAMGMPGGQAMGVAEAVAGDGMPLGEMGSEMPSANSMGTADMPSGEMMGYGMANDVATLMPIGQMVGGVIASMVGIEMTDMPVGDMVNQKAALASQGGGLPVVEITGEWSLTLSSASFKRT